MRAGGEEERFGIAVAQSKVAACPRANGREIRRLMRAGRDGGARLILFPEGALSGYAKSQMRDWNKVDWEAIGDELESIKVLSAELGLWVALGCAYRLEGGLPPHNSLHVISPQGGVACRYDKRMLSNAELQGWYTPGMDALVFEVDGWRFGCALCIEIQFLEIFVEFARQGVDCVLFSAYADSPMFAVQARGYAASLCCWFAGSVPASQSKDLPSYVIGPDGKEQARAEVGKSGLVAYVMDRGDPAFEVALKYARPWRAKAREGGIYR